MAVDNASSEGPPEKENSREPLPGGCRLLVLGTCSVWRCESFGSPDVGDNSPFLSCIGAPGDIGGGAEYRARGGIGARIKPGDEVPSRRAESGTVEAVTM